MGEGPDGARASVMKHAKVDMDHFAPRRGALGRSPVGAPGIGHSH